MARRLVLKATFGADAPERLAQAFTVGATALAAGADVSLWLVAEATWMALPGRAEDLVLPHSAPLSDLRDDLLASGCVTVCIQCAARRGIDAEDLLDGVRLAGAATFVEEALADEARALVY